MPERMENPVEGSVEVRGSLAPDYIEHKQDVSIGQARRRAIAILIVFTNLVPVRIPILFPTPLLMYCKDDFMGSRHRRWTDHRKISRCGWTESSSLDPSIILVRLSPTSRLYPVS